MSYDILLFDADNTLFDFDCSERLTFFEFAPLFRIPATEECYLLYKKFNLESWAEIEKNTAPKEQLLILRYEKLFNALGVCENAQAANEAFLHILSHKGVLYPQTLDLLQTLKGAGKRVYLITNGVASVQHGRIAATDTAKYFDGVFISEVVGASKPSKDFFNAVINAIPDFDREKTLVIGDSLSSDIKGANDSDLPCAWFNPHGKTLPDGFKVDYDVRSLSEIKTILLQR